MGDIHSILCTTDIASLAFPAGAKNIYHSLFGTYTWIHILIKITVGSIADILAFHFCDILNCIFAVGM